MIYECEEYIIYRQNYIKTLNGKPKEGKKKKKKRKIEVL